MALELSVGARNFFLASGGKTCWDADGRLNFYTGTRPANPDDALSSNTLLGTCTLAATAFGTPSGGTMTAAAIGSDTSADASGTCTWARMYKAADDPTGASGTSGTATTHRRADFDVGTSGSDINFAGGVAFVAGGTISISSLTITQPQP